MASSGQSDSEEYKRFAATRKDYFYREKLNMVNFDKAIEKILKQIERDIKESSKQEQKGNIVGAIEIRKEAATKFADIQMSERAAEQYQIVYKLSKSLAERLERYGSDSAGFWYKEAVEALEKTPDARYEDIYDLKARAVRILSEYAENMKIKNGYFRSIIADGTQKAVESMIEREEQKKKMAEKRIANSIARLEKPAIADRVIDALSIGVVSHRKRESTLHEAINREIKIGTELLDKDATEHEKLGERLLGKKEFLGAGREFTVAANICKNNGQIAQAGSLTLRGAQAFEKEGDEAFKKRRTDVARNAYTMAIAVYRQIENTNDSNFVIEKLRRAFEQGINDYIKNKLNGAARTLAEQAKKSFAELGETSQASYFENVKLQIGQ